MYRYSHEGGYRYLYWIRVVQQQNETKAKTTKVRVQTTNNEPSGSGRSVPMLHHAAAGLAGAATRAGTSALMLSRASISRVQSKA